jgi:hypothetical protein
MRRLVPILALLFLTGCGVERTLTVRSDPPGALVYLNGEEAGRTPMRKTFLWYGTYDVQVRKEGYVTKSARTRVWAPWWQVPPIDLLAELVPVKLQDSHAVAYKLQPEAEQQTDPEQVIDRGVRLRRRLRSSKYTRQPVQAPSREEEETR